MLRCSFQKSKFISCPNSTPNLPEKLHISGQEHPTLQTACIICKHEQLEFWSYFVILAVQFFLLNLALDNNLF